MPTKHIVIKPKTNTDIALDFAENTRNAVFSYAILPGLILCGSYLGTLGALEVIGLCSQTADTAAFQVVNSVVSLLI